MMKCGKCSKKNTSCYIVAEIGINHNGSLDMAKKLIKAAAEIGCDAVKFQKRTIDRVYAREYLDSPEQKKKHFSNR